MVLLSVNHKDISRVPTSGHYNNIKIVPLRQIISTGGGTSISLSHKGLTSSWEQPSQRKEKSAKAKKVVPVRFYLGLFRGWKLGNNDSDITVTKNNKKDKIERIPPSQASQIMGVCISPDGTLTLQTEKLREITARWADRILSGHIRRAVSWYFFQSTIKIYLEYPLPATTIT